MKIRFDTPPAASYRKRNVIVPLFRLNYDIGIGYCVHAKII